MEFSQIKIWLAVQLIIDFLLVIGIFWYLLRIRKDLEYRIFKSSSSKIRRALTPFLKDAEKTALQFDSQVKEKRKLIKQLNDTLDTKISSINFIINRAENILNSSLNQFEEEKEEKSDNREEKIIELYQKGYSNEEIAKALGLSLGEVTMIIDLRKKFDSLGASRD